MSNRSFWSTPRSPWLVYVAYVPVMTYHRITNWLLTRRLAALQRSIQENQERIEGLENVIDEVRKQPGCLKEFL